MPSQVQDDRYRDFESRIEDAFSDMGTLGLIRQEVTGADLSDSDCAQLLGRIAQYVADRGVQDEAKLQEDGSDGDVGGPEG